MWRTFASLFVAVAVAMLGIGIIAPILPLYADTFGASGVAIGFVVAHQLEWPEGAALVLALALLFALAVSFRRLRHS